MARHSARVVPQTREVLRMEKVRKVYQRRGRPGVEALRGVSLDLEPGRFVAVMGPSGCGKSTLLRCAAGLETPTDGEVTLLDEPLSRLSDTQRTLLRREHVAFVFQDYTLLPTLDVWRNVGVTHLLSRRPVPKEKMAATLKMLGLFDLRHASPASLSGGQQQRVAIARALVADAKVLYADEPTGALDIATAQTILTALRCATDEGRALLMVTHDPVAASRADEVLMMADGHLALRLVAPTPNEVSEALLELAAR